MHHYLRRLIGVPALAAALALTACGSSEGGGSEDGGAAGGGGSSTVRMTVLYPNSGPIAYYGGQFKKAADVALERINESGDYDFTIETEWVDTACDVAQATSATRKVVQEANTDILFGDFCSSAAKASIALAQPAGLPQVIYGAQDTELTEDYKQYETLFRTVPNNAMTVGALADYIIESGEYDTVAIQYVNTGFGQDGARELRSKLEPAGIEVVASEGFDQAATNLTPFVTKVKPLDPDAVVMISQLTHGTALLKAAAELDWDPTFMSTNVMAWPIFDKEVGPRAIDGMVREFLFYAGDDASPSANEFAEAYEAMHGAEAETYAAEMYDALMVTADALQRAGTGENGFDKAAFVEALSNTTDFEGAMGPLTFTPGDPQAALNGRITFIRNDDAELVPLEFSTEG